MSHQPPVPEGSQSPYPLQRAPIPEDVKQRAAERQAEEADAQARTRPSQRTLFGIAGAVALGAAAALGGYLHSRGKPVSGKGAKSNRSGKRKSGKARARRKMATGETRH